MPTIPRRESELARPRSRKGGDQQETKRGVMKDVRWKQPDPDWHPVARDLYLSARSSGQADWYQNSDIHLLWSLCDDLSHYKKSGRRSAQMAAVIYTAFGNLLLTEGDRRKARIELTEQKPEQTPASVTAIQGYKDRLAGPAGRTAPSE